MIPNQLEIVGIWILLLSPIKDIGSKKTVGLRNLVVDASGGKILIGDLFRDEFETPGISSCRGTREGK